MFKAWRFFKIYAQAVHRRPPSMMCLIGCARLCHHPCFHKHMHVVPVQEGAHMRQRLEAWRASPEGAAWMAKRGGLPVVQIRDSLLAALETADVAVVGGDTGCGKTTQATPSSQATSVVSYQHSDRIAATSIKFHCVPLRRSRNSCWMRPLRAAWARAPAWSARSRAASPRSPWRSAWRPSVGSRRPAVRAPLLVRP